MTRRVRHVAPSGRGRLQHGQGLVEFALLVPVFLLLLLGMIEFGFAFTHNQTLEYATREGARTGAALSHGSAQVACSSVDENIIAAVERVLTSAGSPIAGRLSKIPTIDIYDANTSGDQIGSAVDVWSYAAGAGPVVDGKALDYRLTSTGWDPCTAGNRKNGATPDSIGVSLSYTYDLMTPLGGILRFFGGSTWTTLAMGDRTVMALEPTQ